MAGTVSHRHTADPGDGRRDTLQAIYSRALQACAPDVLIRKFIRPEFPRIVVAIGKCAGALLDGFGEFDKAFVAIPAGYPRPRASRNVIVFEGGHPEMTAASFVAGKAVIEFVAAHDEITFLISGGGSACVEWPLAPFTQKQVIDLNARLIRSGASIHDINEQRKRVSAIKGGRLAARLKRSVTLVYSDVSIGAIEDVASGPSIASGEVHVVADNSALTAAAATIARQLGFVPVLLNRQIEGDVESAATELAHAAAKLNDRKILIAGGEPTVMQHGDGKGGRCTELAVRFALAAREMRIHALFGSSDGVDGNSGAAAVMVALPATLDRAFVDAELARSNSIAIINAIGTVLPLCPTGNNLRDIYLLACS